MNVITASEIAVWKSCRRKWFFRYHEKLVPLSPAKAITFGSLVHHVLEYYYNGDDWETVLEIDSMAVRAPTYKMDERDIARAAALVEEYIERDPVKRQKHTVIGVEAEFGVKIPGGLIFAGKIDLITKDKWGNTWFWDHKTVSKMPSPSWLQIADQMQYYLWAGHQMGLSPVGIAYNVIRKPTIAAHDKDAIRADIKKRWSTYFMTEWIYKSPRDIERAGQDLLSVASEIGNPPFYRNPAFCQYFGCPYRDICLNDTKVTRMGYKQANRHSELKLDWLDGLVSSNDMYYIQIRR